MRSGFSTIQQTLTTEASSVLNLSIAEASRRNHGQTTPLHVAATLLASPSGYLRKACIRSHPDSSHPLQSRALELCFSVALDRLPAGQNMDGEPPISNALMAALKRAQANQRRGCPEQQQQPLLAVKVELEQLIISILDDPSVSRVMREASFSSPAVKASIEQSLNNSKTHHPHVNFGGIPPRSISNPSQLSLPPLASSPSTSVNRNMYMNPRLATAAQPGNPKVDDVHKVFDIMSRREKRNPILVGDLEPEAVVKEFMRKIENKEFENDSNLKNVQVIPMDKGIFSDKNHIAAKVEELGDLIESKIRNGGVILDLGDLKWLVEKHPKQTVVSETGMAAVTEMTKLLGRFSSSDDCNKLWLIGTATCETYLRCQVYHSTMENDWDLQAVPVAPRSPLFSRVSTLTSSPTCFSENATRNMPTICPQCSEDYKKELTKHAAIEKSFKTSLPQWLQNAKLSTDESHKTQELQKKWKDTCLHLHPNFHQKTRPNLALHLTSLHNPNIIPRPPFLPKPTIKPLGEALQLNMNQGELVPSSPVVTDLVLGTKDEAKDLLGCISSEPVLDKFSNAVDADTYKKLLKGLMEKAWWQAEAASAVASAITRCRMGNGKRRSGGSRGDAWLLFTGPDRVGKRKMACVLAEQLCGASASLVTICLVKRRDEEECDTSLRGKTVIDRVAEAVRRNPVTVILLEDFDEADTLVCASVKQAIERGRLTDSHGREIGLGNVVFIVTGDWSRTSPESVRDGRFVDEKRVASVARGGWQLGLIIREKNAKRSADWPEDEGRLSKQKKETTPGFGLPLDLNLEAAFVDEGSSDLTFEHDDDLGLLNTHFSITSAPHGLVSNVNDSIVFKPVSWAFVRREIKKTISAKFSTAVDENLSIEVEDDVVDKILGGLWHDRTSLGEWTEKVLGPGFDQLKDRLRGGDRCSSVVRLVVESDCSDRGKSEDNADWLPSTILV